MLRAIVLGAIASVAAVHAAEAQRFSAPTAVTTGHHPAAVLAADFTGTGAPELLAFDDADPSGGAAAAIRVLANSQGRFSLAPAVFTQASALLTMRAFAGGLPDLYTASLSGNQVTLFRATAQTGGTYSPERAATSFPLSGSAPPQLLLAAGGLHAGFENSIVLADIANDQLYTALPNSDGTYGIQPAYGLPGLPLIAGATQLLTTDLNGDGVPDLLVAGANGVQVFLASHTNMSFTGFSLSITYPCTGTVQSIALADMDGDSHPDLLVEGANGRVDIYHGNADGTFAAASEAGTGVENASTGRGGHLVGVADLNADGLPDLVLANPQGITVLLGTGARNFQLAATYPTASVPASFVFTDLNGDGKPDLAFDTPQGVTILYSQDAVTANGQLTAAPEPSVYGAAFTLDLQLTTPANAAMPTGTVDFSVDGAVVGTGTLSNGQASFAVTSPMYLRGSHTLTAVYSGDAVYASATFNGNHTVQGLPSVSAITNLVTPIYYGQEIGYTNGIDAVVSAIAADPGVPPAAATLDGGDIYVYLDGLLVCSLQIGAVGSNGGPQRCNDANFQGYPAGTHTMVAAYQGNSYYAPSTSAAYTVVILPDDTAATLSTSQTPASFGSTVTFTATLSAPYATPAGSVAFLDGSVLLGAGVLNTSGTAAFSTSTLKLGTHLISAVYAATQNFNASQASLTEVIAAVSATTLTSSLNPSFFGQSVTFTAAASIAGSPAVASGTVTFTDNGSFLASAPLDAQGDAAYTTSTLAVGQHPIVATFVPLAVSTIGSTASLTQIVNVAPPNDFTLTVSPSSLTIGVGNTGSVTVTVTPTGTFAAAVALTCSGLPSEATCTFVTPTIPPGGGSTLLAIHPEAPHNCGDSAEYFIAGSQGTLSLALGAATSLLVGWRRRRLRAALFAMALCVLTNLGGCGWGHCTDLGTRPGDYSFLVTGAAAGGTALSHSQAVHIRAFISNP